MAVLINLFFTAGTEMNLKTMYSARQIELLNLEGEAELTKGWILYNLGKYDEAGKSMMKVLQVENDISAQHCLGLIDLHKGNYNSAVKRMEGVLRESPGHIPSLLNLGKAQYYAGEYHSAALSFKKVLKLQPTHREALFWKGRATLIAGF